MKKDILAIFIGIFAAFLVIAGMEYLSSVVYPMPVGDYEDPAFLAEIMKNMPLGAMLTVLAGYALGSVAGGAAATRMHPENGKRNAIIIGVVLLAFGIMNMLMIPHPAWFWVASSAVYVPCALLGRFLLIYLVKP